MNNIRYCYGTDCEEDNCRCHKVEEVKLESFESYLQDKFMEDFTGTKDEFEDAYEAWLEWNGLDMLMELGDKYGKKCYVAGQKTLPEANNQNK